MWYSTSSMFHETRLDCYLSMSLVATPSSSTMSFTFLSVMTPATGSMTPKIYCASMPWFKKSVPKVPSCHSIKQCCCSSLALMTKATSFICPVARLATIDRVRAGGVTSKYVAREMPLLTIHPAYASPLVWPTVPQICPRLVSERSRHAV